MEVTKEQRILMRAACWISEDANEGCEQAKEIVEGLEELVKLFAKPDVSQQRELLLAVARETADATDNGELTTLEEIVDYVIANNCAYASSVSENEQPRKSCPKCNSTNVIQFSKSDDKCKDCNHVYNIWS